MDATAASALLQQGRSLEAVRAFDTLLAGLPQSPLAERVPLLLGKAQGHLALQLYRRCLADCNAVLVEAPFLPEAVRIKAAALVAMKKHAHAEALLARCLGRPECKEGQLTAALRKLLEEVQQVLDAPAIAAAEAKKRKKAAAASAAAASATVSAAASGSAHGGGAAAPAHTGLFSLETKVMLVKVGFAAQTVTPAGAFDIDIDAAKLASLRAATADMDHRSGDFDRDVKVVLSYLLVNNRHYDEAIPLLDTILEDPRRQKQQDGSDGVDASCFGALLSRGSARAMKGGGNTDASATAAGGGSAVALTPEEARDLMEGAVADFSKAAAVKPQSAAAFQKLAQVLSALGRDHEALAAYDAAIKLGIAGHKRTTKQVPDAQLTAEAQAQHLECLQGRGLLHKRLNDYEAAIADLHGPVLERAMRTPGMSNPIFQLAISLNNVGRCEEAVELYTKVATAMPEEGIVIANIAECYKHMGEGDKALATFQKALAVEPVLLRSYQLYADCYYHLGRFRKALLVARAGSDMVKQAGAAVKTLGYDRDVRWMAGLCLQGMGRFQEADAAFSELVAEQPDHDAWFARELLRFFASSASSSGTLEWSRPIVGGLQSQVKLASTRKPPARQWKAQHPQYVPQPADACAKAAVAAGVAEAAASASTTRQANEKRLLVLADGVGKLLQLQCRGFLSNRVQQRQFGFAVLQMAQHIRRLWALPTADGSGSTSGTDGGGGGDGGAATASDNDEAGAGWRSVMQIAANWRQVSEPNTSVWWIDETPAEEFAAGFGLETLIEAGHVVARTQLHIIRYHPYCGMSLALAKTLVLEQCALTDELREKVASTTTPRELRELLGHDFWVVNRCASSYVKGRIMEGTRLTFEAKRANGINYGIRIASTPTRWAQFSEELQLLWRDLRRVFRQGAVLRHTQEGGGGGGGDSAASDADATAVGAEYTRLAQRFFFFWVNFAPLSRGSAATGYAALFALMLANDAAYVPQLPTGPVAPGVQLDWECILRHSADEVAAATLEPGGPLYAWYSSWFGPARVALGLAGEGANGHVLDTAVPSVAEHVPTLHDALRLLHLGID